MSSAGAWGAEPQPMLRTSASAAPTQPWAHRDVRVGTATVGIAEVRSTLAGADLAETFTNDELADARRRSVEAADPIAAELHRLTVLVAAKTAAIAAVGGGRLVDAVVRFDDDGDAEVSVPATTPAVGFPAAPEVSTDTSLRITDRGTEISAVVAVISATPLPRLVIPPPSVDPLATLAEMCLDDPTDPRESR